MSQANMLSGWMCLILPALALASFAARRYAPQVHFFRTDLGAGALAALTAMLAAASQTLMDHGLSWSALAPALSGAFLSALALADAGHRPAPDAPPAEASKQLSLLPMLALIGLALGAQGCAYCKQAQNANKAVCLAEQAIVKCGPELLTHEAEILPVLIGALSGTEIDWAGIVKLEEEYGIETVTCLIHRADSMAALPTGRASQAFAKMHVRMVTR